MLTCNCWGLNNHKVSVPRLTGITLTLPFQMQLFDEKGCCFTFKHWNDYTQQFTSKMLQYKRQQIPFTQAVIAFVFLFNVGQVGYKTSCFSIILSLVLSSRSHPQKRARLTYVTTTNTHVGILISNMPATPDKETSPAFTSCVLEHHSQGQTAHMMSHRQHISVANPESHSSHQWKLATYQNSGKLPGNFNTKHEKNGSKVSTGP